MDREWLLRQNEKWKAACQGVLFQSGDILEHKKKTGQTVANISPKLPS